MWFFVWCEKAVRGAFFTLLHAGTAVRRLLPLYEWIDQSLYLFLAHVFLGGERKARIYACHAERTVSGLYGGLHRHVAHIERHLHGKSVYDPSFERLVLHGGAVEGIEADIFPAGFPDCPRYAFRRNLVGREQAADCLLYTSRCV